MNYGFTSESVTEGHPDKVCDYIADSILDAHIEQDPRCRVACEVLCKENLVVVGGEITSRGRIVVEDVVRRALRDVGYNHPTATFNAERFHLLQMLSGQAVEIARGVDREQSAAIDQGAGDQGIMFGYASDETPELMPLPIVLAHRMAAGLAEDRQSGAAEWLRPDGKTQVTVQYEDGRPARVTNVLVSAQHAGEIRQPAIRAYVEEKLAPRTLGQWHNADIRFQVNPAGSFVHGGPAADCGVTGRKIIVDTYGGAAHHGGGSFSGKDPSKVDRSGAYFARYVARQIVKQGIAHRAEIQVAYAIGLAAPVSIKVDTFGTGDVAAGEELVRKFDFRPAAVIEHLDLLRPIYRRTTNYGHFGKPGLPWES